MLSFLPDFLITRLLRKRKGCFIDVLSNDIIVDHIFIYLSVEDILSVRRVSKLYYYLTHQSIIWKRFLRHINVPLPPLPPTPRYALGQLDFEAEKLVFRAISLDDNWRNFKPKLYRSQLLRVYNYVLAMTVLPGGKYLVASVKDRGCNRYAIMVFVLDHATRGSIALAKTPTKSKAYNLQAKYMSFNGVQGIAIAYIRRKFKGNKQCGINPSDYSHMTEIDPPVPLQYECVCLHISLLSLELLGDPRVSPASQEFYKYAAGQPPPFREMARIRSSAPLDSVTLFEYDGMPFVSVVKGPDSIVIKDLTSRIISTLRCEPFEPMSDLPHTIRAVGIFPAQNQILVVRSVPPVLYTPEATHMHMFEIYDAPVRGDTTTRSATDRYIYDNKHIASFHISDHNLVTQHDQSVQPSLLANKPPSPISIFCRTIKPHGLHHYMVWPTHVDFPLASGEVNKAYYYSLSYVSEQSRHECDPNVTYVLPGAYRALLYTVPSDDRTDTPSLLNLRRYVAPEVPPFGYPKSTQDDLDEEHRVMKKRQKVPYKLYSSLDLPKGLAAKLKEDGVRAVAWDEGVGRVCIASSHDSVIHILDFAQTSTRI